MSECASLGDLLGLKLSYKLSSWIISYFGNSYDCVVCGEWRTFTLNTALLFLYFPKVCRAAVLFHRVTLSLLWQSCTSGRVSCVMAVQRARNTQREDTCIWKPSRKRNCRPRELRGCDTRHCSLCTQIQYFGINRSWAEISRTVSQCTSFLYVSVLPQVLCYSGRRLIPQELMPNFILCMLSSVNLPALKELVKKNHFPIKKKEKKKNQF